MPIYTYECEICGARFDAKQSFNDVPLTVCPTCEGKIHRVIQPVGVVFKGSGFYVNDSRSKQNLATTGSGKKEDGKSGDSGSSESASTPTKSEGASETTTAKPAAETAAPAKSATSSEPAK